MAGDTPGPDSLLTDELTLKIRGLVLKGNKYVEIQRQLEISDSTWDTWVYKNCKDFRVKLNDWKAERLIKKSEDLSDEILDMPHDDSRILRIKQKEAEFVRETLAKDRYSKRNELTGADGGALMPNEEQRRKSDQAIDEYLNRSNTQKRRPIAKKGIIRIQPKP